MTSDVESSELMSPKIDFVFKLIFGDEKHKDITIGFLSAVLQVPKDDLADIEIINTELLREFKEDKKGILDVRVKTRDGRQINERRPACVRVSRRDSRSRTPRPCRLGSGLSHLAARGGR